MLQTVASGTLTTIESTGLYTLNTIELGSAASVNNSGIIFKASHKPYPTWLCNEIRDSHRNTLLLGPRTALAL